MKITVIGAGAIGSAVVYDLAQDQRVAQIQVCDARPGALKELQERVPGSRLRSFQINARDVNVLSTIAKGSDCVISCASPEVNPKLADLCLRLGVNFCDLGGSEEVVQKELSLHEAARRKSIWIVPNCGLAPGLVNIICMQGVEQFEEVTTARLRVGDVPLQPNPPFNFHLTFSAEKLIDDYTEPASIIHDGSVIQVPPLTGVETIRFPKPFGEMEAFYTSGGLSTLPSDLEGRVASLDYKTVRYPGHADQLRFLFALGLAEKRTIDVRTHLTYRELLARRMRQRLASEKEDAVLLRVSVTGKQKGRVRTLTYEMIDRFDPERQLTAMKRCTAFPAAAVALLLASGKIPGGGAGPPERIVPKDLFFKAMAARNLNITRRWHDHPAESLAVV